MNCRPLKLNFPQDCLPERTLLARLLGFAAKGGHGDKQQISEATGIPTGKSTGKVEPMLHYGCAMGLIEARSARGVWHLQATELGQLVATQDPFLGEEVTQWVCHLLLCRRGGRDEPPRGLADAWFTLFAEGGGRLGSRFTRDTFAEALRERHGETSALRGLSGLVPRTYLEPGSFAALNALRLIGAGNDTYYERVCAPATRSLFPALTAALFLAWDRLFPGQQQVPLNDLLKVSRVLAVLHWRQGDAESWIGWMRTRHLIGLDQLTGDILILRLVPTLRVVGQLYDELV